MRDVIVNNTGEINKISGSQSAKGTIQLIIIKKAAHHLEAAKHPLEAIKHHAAGDHDKAYASRVLVNTLL